jgi:hypothetical protein
MPLIFKSFFVIASHIVDSYPCMAAGEKCPACLQCRSGGKVEEGLEHMLLTSKPWSQYIESIEQSIFEALAMSAASESVGNIIFMCLIVKDKGTREVLGGTLANGLTYQYCT